ncbi:MAG: hypothetical protein M1834_008064 [Cirrosporium novae-zelandiae]|nr:MAG: hypothetical protein M1834_008064 [Cirrosporium novae-zelandiae]
MATWSISLVLTSLRVVELLFALLCLGTGAYVADWYNTDTASPSPNQINAMVFISAWTPLALVYLYIIPRYYPRFANRWALLALEAITMFMWLAGWIALSIFLADLMFCRGKVCHAAQATTVLGSFQWATLVITLVLKSIETLRAHRIVKAYSEKWPSMQQA